ncbi:Protein of unknown function [Bacillus cereus]|jgi:hypothetical protein
MQIRL